MNKYIKYFLWLFTAAWMAVIFMFSAEDSQESTMTSDSVLDRVLNCLIDDYGELGVDHKIKLFEKYSFYIRKSAHFSAYAILGILTSASVHYGKRKGKNNPADVKSMNGRSAEHMYSANQYSGTAGGRPVLISFVICAVYACTDELHQYFVPGRSCSITDVVIDCSGAAVGIAVFLFVRFIISKIKKRTAVKNSRA